MHHLGKLTTGTIALGLLTIALTGLAPTAAADPGGEIERNCYQIYIFEGQVGPVTVDASDSCPEVQVDPDWRPTTTDSTIPPCSGIDDDREAGPVTAGVDAFCDPHATIDAGPAGNVTVEVDRSNETPIDVSHEDTAVPAHGTGIHCEYDTKTLTGYCYFD